MRSMDAKLRARFRRKLCYGNPADLETPSLPLTEAAVDFFQDTMPVPEGLGRLDLDTASRISGQSGVSPCSMVMSVLYAKRLKHRNAHYLQSMSSSDIFFISMMMASKYLYDEGVDEEVFNDEWAEVTGQEGKEVNQMEIDFLDAMDWGLFVRPEEFEDTLDDLEKRLALKEGLKRGWFTYTELGVLLDNQLLYNLWNQVGMDCSKLAVISSVAYLASVVSMIGSAAIAIQLSGPLTTATLAILSMQSSCFGPSSSIVSAVVSTKPNLHGDVVPFTDVDSNVSLSKDFLVPKLMQTTQEHSTEKIDLSESGNETSLKVPVVSYEDQKMNSDVKENRTDSPPVKLARSSVLSLWFFDSLLSQIWSVMEQKPQQLEEGCDRCQHSSLSLMKNTQSFAGNGQVLKTCKYCQPSCSCKSSRRQCRIQRTTGLFKHSHLPDQKRCKVKRHSFNPLDDSQDDGIWQGEHSSILSSSCITSERHNSFTCHVSNAEEVSSVPLSNLDSSSNLELADHSSRERKNSAFLNTVLDQYCKLSSFLLAFGPHNENAILSGLPGWMLLT